MVYLTVFTLSTVFLVTPIHSVASLYVYEVTKCIQVTNFYTQLNNIHSKMKYALFYKNTKNILKCDFDPRKGLFA